MLSNFIIWGSVIYFSIIVIWRLYISIVMIIAGWKTDGFGGAVLAGLMNFLINVWDLTKFIIYILIIAFVYKACFK